MGHLRPQPTTAGPSRRQACRPYRRATMARCRRRASHSAIERAGVTMFVAAVAVLAVLTGLLSAHAP